MNTFFRFWKMVALIVGRPKIISHAVEEDGMEKESSVSLMVVWVTTFWVIGKMILTSATGFQFKTACCWFDGISLTGKKIIQHRTTSLALEYLYAKRIADTNWLGAYLSRYWLRLRNAQAVRNRLHITIQRLQDSITTLNKKNVVVLSIASGSAEAVIQSALWAKNQGITVHMYLLDRDGDALERARRRAEALGIAECIVQCFQVDIGNLENIATQIPKPDIIEMVGFLDYRKSDKTLRLLSRLRNLLPANGKLITAQICPNPEQWFVQYVLGWRMIYRTPEEMGALVIQSGFDQGAVNVLIEPWCIHCVVIATKT